MNNTETYYVLFDLLNGTFYQETVVEQHRDGNKLISHYDLLFTSHLPRAHRFYNATDAKQTAEYYADMEEGMFVFPEMQQQMKNTDVRSVNVTHTLGGSYDPEDSKD